MIFEVLVEVRLRRGIADPQGATIQKALGTLGFAGVSNVRAGKSYRFEVAAADAEEARRRAEDLCARLLTNPVIEESAITVEAPSSLSGRQVGDPTAAGTGADGAP